MVLGTFHLARQGSRLKAYNALQLELMQCFIRRGGTPESWCERYALAFRRRFGWMMGD